jgi:hypothetical protein
MYLTTPMTVALEPRYTSRRGPPLSPALEEVFTTKSICYFQHFYVQQKLCPSTEKEFLHEPSILAQPELFSCMVLAQIVILFFRQ